MSICVIFNPSARGERASGLHAPWRGLGSACTSRPTRSPGEARLLAAEAVRQGFGTIVAAGGDGTVHEVIEGLAAEPAGLAGTRLGILPLGTANVFARELGIPLAPAAACETILGGRERAVDLLSLEVTGSEGAPERRLCVQLAGAGLDARAVELVSFRLKRRFGFLSYVVAALRAWLEAAPRIVAHADGRRAEASAVLVGNGRFYGGSFPFFPRARPDDGLFDVAIFPRVTPATALRTCWTVVSGNDAVSRGAAAWQTASLRLTSDGRVPFQIDGEPAGRLPVTIDVRPKALRVIVPAA